MIVFSYNKSKNSVDVYNGNDILLASMPMGESTESKKWNYTTPKRNDLLTGCDESSI